MDPRTGYPAQGMYSVSVIAPQSIDSEAWTKPYLYTWTPMGGGHIPNVSRVFVRRQNGDRPNARGSNEQPLSRRLPPPSDRCSAGVVYAAGGPVYEAVPGDPREALASSRSANGRTLPRQVTLQPVEILDVDAAIIFADLLLPVEPMGLKLEFLAGEGPVIDNPVRTSHDVDSLSISNTDDLGLCRRGDPTW